MRCNSLNIAAGLLLFGVLADAADLTGKEHGAECDADEQCLSSFCSSNKCSCPDAKYYDHATNQCEPRFIEKGSKLYKVLNYRAGSHDTAAALCAQHNAMLPEPKTEIENQNLATLGSEIFYIGMSDSAEEGKWVWDSDGSDVTWFEWIEWTEPGWGGTNPNGGTRENCAVMLKDHGKGGEGHRHEGWADKPCDKFPVHVVCQKKATTTTTPFDEGPVLQTTTTPTTTTEATSTTISTTAAPESTTTSTEKPIEKTQDDECSTDEQCTGLMLCWSKTCRCRWPDQQYFDTKTAQCESRKEHGAECDADEQCLSSVCSSNKCSCPDTKYYDHATKQCEPLKQPGEECKADEQCVYNCTANKCSCQDAYFYDVKAKMCKELTCPDGYKRYGIYCYKFHLIADWQLAGVFICESRKGMLPQPKTDEENDIINSILKENIPAIDKKFPRVKHRDQVWLGGKCKRNKKEKTCTDWYWQNNKKPLIPADQFKWAFRQNNQWKGDWQACLTYWADKGWNDYTCWLKLPVLCEYRKNAKGELNPHAVLKKDKLWSDFIKKHGHPYKPTPDEETVDWDKID